MWYFLAEHLQLCEATFTLADASNLVENVVQYGCDCRVDGIGYVRSKGPRQGDSCRARISESREASIRNSHNVLVSVLVTESAKMLVRLASRHSASMVVRSGITHCVTE